METEYLVTFSSNEEKLEFVDAFCGAAMNNWMAPFRDQYIDNEAVILINTAFLGYFQKKFPNATFVEADKTSEKYLRIRKDGVDIKPSWGDDY